MDCNDRIGMWQKDHTAQSPSACQVLPEWARHLLCAEPGKHSTRLVAPVIDQVPVEQVIPR